MRVERRKGTFGITDFTACSHCWRRCARHCFACQSSLGDMSVVLPSSATKGFDSDDKEEHTDDGACEHAFGADMPC